MLTIPCIWAAFSCWSGAVVMSSSGCFRQRQLAATRQQLMLAPLKQSLQAGELAEGGGGGGGGGGLVDR